jgi:imidazoleglycerol-phosphate dehydratase
MTAPRRATIARDTKETRIRLRLDLDDASSRNISTGVGFFDHMLEALALHGGLGLDVDAEGDLHIDQHHLVEDVGIVLGTALREALGSDLRIVRFAHAYAPLDESLVRAVVDVSGRSHLWFDVDISRHKVGDFDTELVEEFFRAFTSNAKLTLHLELLHGTNSHHQIEATFKACALALRQALRPLSGGDTLRSTKGTLSEAQARQGENSSEESTA